MSYCKYCDQEIIQEHFEGEIDICTDCIMDSSRIYSMKFASLSCLIVIISIIFVISLIELIMSIPTLNVDENIIYFIITLTVCIITSNSLLGLLLYIKKIKT